MAKQKSSVMTSAVPPFLPSSLSILTKARDFKPEGHTHDSGKITPGYALFIGVAGVLILLLSTVLLTVDKRVDEIVYREKITQ
ncbi:unnamed protein product [Hydatigera taeniaeformis]|uniref:Essential MCU regulator, mitochondrial n=1 Tax=Hydatigena taeniaeformis TaxID=6205 RepID=A0A0R3XAT8_HYDTA|nr:unnamed protein product [Hydatigera taeniaeformis]